MSLLDYFRSSHKSINLEKSHFEVQPAQSFQVLLVMKRIFSDE